MATMQSKNMSETMSQLLTSVDKDAVIAVSESVDKSVLLTWNGHTFKVSSALVYSFNALTIKGSNETEDKGSKNKYVSRKSGKPYEVSFTILLNRMLGVEDVLGEARTWTQEARLGKSDYIYFAGQKLYAAKFMLTEASVSNIEMMPDGTWIGCEVKCTFKTSSKADKQETETTKKKSSSHKSSKSSSSKKKKTTSGGGATKDDVDVVTSAAPKAKQTTAQKAISYVVGLAASAAKKYLKK